MAWEPSDWQRSEESCWLFVSQLHLTTDASLSPASEVTPQLGTQNPSTKFRWQILPKVMGIAWNWTWKFRLTDSRETRGCSSSGGGASSQCGSDFPALVSAPSSTVLTPFYLALHVPWAYYHWVNSFSQLPAIDCAAFYACKSFPIFSAWKNPALSP